jgi:hypothetical protein
MKRSQPKPKIFRSHQTSFYEFQLQDKLQQSIKGEKKLKISNLLSLANMLLMCRFTKVNKQRKMNEWAEPRIEK